MNPILLDAFRHNAWATKTLLNVCRDLSDEQLEVTTPGVYGGIRDTLQHVVLAEESYHRRITDIAPKNPVPDEAVLSMSEIEQRADDIAKLWESVLSQEIDADRIVHPRGDDGTVFDTAIGVVFAQILVHGNEHRGQICTILTTLGIEPPTLGAWEYGLETGRMAPQSNS